MNSEQKLQVFRSLFAAHPPSAAPSNSASLTSSHPSSRSTPPPDTLPHPSNHLQHYASSDADTVEPPSDITEPPHPPRPATSSFSHVCSPMSTRLLTVPNLHHSDTHSVSSGAETVPPPSPPVRQRVRAKNSLTSPVARIVTVDDLQLDHLERDQSFEFCSNLNPQYPKLKCPKFQHPVEDDVQLSNCRSPSTSFGLLPANICRFLSPFQRDGVTFLYRLYERGRGGLLADAMGLGKTVQAICFLGAAFAIWNREQRISKCKETTPRILIVAPVSVKENWKREFETWTPFKVTLYDKPNEPLISRMLQNGTIDVIITGDNPVAAKGNTFFSKPFYNSTDWQWDVVIVDEIHVAKNCNTNIYKALSNLPKKVMFGLTGTAVQNRLKELWNVMSLVVPASLWPSSVSFREDFIKVINKGTKRDASTFMRTRARDRIDALRKLLGKHMVRRPKCIIDNELPSKTDYCVFMRMKPLGVQSYMYRRFQNSYDVKLVRDALTLCDCGSEEISKECCHRFPASDENKADAPIWRMHHKDLLPCDACPNCLCFYLQHVSRSIATHALLVLPDEDERDLEKKENRRMLFRYYVGEYAKKMRRPITTLEQESDMSCKLSVALRLLKSYERHGHKTIIFYESLRLGGILKRWAINNGLIFEVIDGSVTTGRRQIAVDRFNANPLCSIFFISKKAGGTGLNISGADRVLIFEPCWNPTLDLQAGDRAHRLGQKRSVDILRLVVENTIEHYVWNTAISKSQVSSAILDNTNEEWHIGENEIGNMRAMLQMGSNEEFIGTENFVDDFRVEKAGRDDNVKLKKASSQKSGTISGDDEQDHNNITEGNGVDVDVLGKAVVCSLDVDIDYDEDFSSHSNKPVNSEDDEGSNIARCNVEKPFDISESQPDRDAVLQEAGASSKFIMTSTNARKRGRQFMGRDRDKRRSGINPDGPANVNFDDASFHRISTPCEPESEIGDDLPIKRKRVTRSHKIASAKSIQERYGSVTMETVRGRPPNPVRSNLESQKQALGANIAGVEKGNKNSDKPLKRSTFATRAKIRR